MSPITVSALIVTYQHARYVESAVRSTLDQTVPIQEVVVVDDGSTDGTARRAAVRDPRVHVYSQQHRGLERLSETYAYGLERCRGDVVAVLEGDDVWPRDKLERQLPAFLDPRVVVAHGPYAVIGPEGNTIASRIAPDPEPTTGPYDAVARHLLQSYVMPVTAVIRASDLRATGFRQLPGTPHWDHPTFLALAERGAFAYTTAVVGNWRKHRFSATARLTGSDLAGADLSLQLALSTRARLRDVAVPSADTIRRAWADAFGRQVWQTGRILLLRARFAEARRMALAGLIRSSSLGLRLRLAALLVAGVLHTDLDRWRRFLGRASPIEDLA